MQSIPVSHESIGRSASKQAAAKPFGEETVFHVAHAYEQATAWHTRHPDLHRIDSGAIHS